MGYIIWYITSYLEAKTGKKLFRFWRRERSLGNEVGSIMLFWLALLKTTGNKVVLDFCAILAPHHDIWKKYLLLLTNFQGTFLAVLVLANRFSSNLE